MASKNFFIYGITELLILSILSKGDTYVYEITKSITKYSNDLLSISQNTIYTATYKLEEDRLITEYSKLVGKKRTRVYYHLEPKGEEYLKQISTNYQNVTNGVANILKTLESKGESTNE